jgi:hypothetical protein
MKYDCFPIKVGKIIDDVRSSTQINKEKQLVNRNKGECALLEIVKTDATTDSGLIHALQVIFNSEPTRFLNPVCNRRSTLVVSLKLENKKAKHLRNEAPTSYSGLYC